MDIKNNHILSLICGLFISVSVVNAESADMFETFKSFVSTNSEGSYSVEIVSNGKTIDEVVNEKAKDKYKIAATIKNNSSNNEYEPDKNTSNGSTNSGGTVNNGTSNNGNSSNSSDEDRKFYFAGTTDFTNIATSRQDAMLNGWSAIRESYSKYDDNGEDNITIIATAYTSAAEENGGYAGMNAIGGKLGPGCIAAPKDIPFHTKIRISGLGVFNVEDRGGAIVRVDNNTIRIDVWMDSYKEAMHFGKRVYKGRIIK